MDDNPPPQDQNPNMMNDYVKNDSAEGDNTNGGGPLDNTAVPMGDNDNNAASSAMDPVSANGTNNDGGGGMMNDNTEEGGLPSGMAGDNGGGNLYLRPIFLGNLSHNCVASDIETIFTNPSSGSSVDNGEVKMPVALDRVDMKRGYAFVFLKDPESLAEKERAENFVQEINGMYVPSRIIFFLKLHIPFTILSHITCRSLTVSWVIT
mmetsp:Transcript_15552/g.27893  ORF Transcript_15552/g.27893 Transcript_15552/m.27893 type:complete len:207 (+) Transcript_15552:82-702(+)